MGTLNFGPSKKTPLVPLPTSGHFEASDELFHKRFTRKFDDSPDRRNLVGFGVDIFAFFEARLFWAPFLLEMMLLSVKNRHF